MRVHKLDLHGNHQLTYDAEIEERFDAGVRLAARWTHPTRDLGYTIFETGDHFTEWFFCDRWYNIFEIASVEGMLKGWYCNVAAPAEITEDDIFCRDLLLDLWVSAEGATLVLDEDEFAAEPALAKDDVLRRQALAGLVELRRLVAERREPFTRLAQSQKNSPAAAGEDDDGA